MQVEHSPYTLQI